MKEIKYEIEDEVIISEKQNKVTKLSIMKWGNSNESKFDIRNWFIKSTLEDSEVFPGKGISLGKEDADILTESLLEYGCGNIKNVKNIIEKRDLIEIFVPEMYDDYDENYDDDEEIDNDYINPDDLLN